MISEMEKLNEAVTRVKNLLDDPHPGLMSWNDLLREACKENQEALCAMGVTPEACGIKKAS